MNIMCGIFYSKKQILTRMNFHLLDQIIQLYNNMINTFVWFFLVAIVLLILLSSCYDLEGVSERENFYGRRWGGRWGRWGGRPYNRYGWYGSWPYYGYSYGWPYRYVYSPYLY